MKQYIYDFLIALLILCIGQIYFANHNVERTMFQRNVEQFEKDIENSEQVNSYVATADKEDNQISLFFLTISQGCVKVIEYIVFIFSQIVSMLFTIMVY